MIRALRRAAGAVLLVAFGATGGCHGCASCGTPAALRVEGPSPYVRCNGLEPPAPFERKLGRLELVLDGRTLRARKTPTSLRVAALSGPAPWRGPVDDAVGELRGGHPDLILLLGNLGDTEAEAARVLRAVGRVPAPTVVLAGGRDTVEVVDAALDALDGAGADRVIDGRGLDRLVLGPDELVLVSGAPGGRYARSADACGVGRQDLDALADDLGPEPDEARRRWLVGWAAPAGWAGPVGLGGVDPGDAALARFAERVGAGLGLYAWPAGASDGRTGKARRVPAMGPPAVAAAGRGGRPGHVRWVVLTPEGPQFAPSKK